MRRGAWGHGIFCLCIFAFSAQAIKNLLSRIFHSHLGQLGLVSARTDDYSVRRPLTAVASSAACELLVLRRADFRRIAVRRFFVAVA